MSSVINYEIGGFTYYHNVEENPDKNNFRRHTHESLELYYFISGDAVSYIEGNEYKLRPGDILIIREGETHFLKLLTDTPYERIVLNFSKSFLSVIDPKQKLLDAYYNRILGKDNLIKGDFLMSEVLPILIKLENADGNTDYYKSMEIKVFLSYILLQINDYYHKRVTPEIESYTSESFSKIILYINDNLSDNLSLDSISQKFYISKSYLNRLFKQKTGFTVWQYITTKRMVFAKSLIEKDMSTIKVSELSGFKDYSSFYRQYKKHFGCSPKEANNYTGEAYEKNNKNK